MLWHLKCLKQLNTFYLYWLKSQILISYSRTAQFIVKENCKPKHVTSRSRNIRTYSKTRCCVFVFSVADIVDLLSHSTIWTHAPSHNAQHTVLAWRGYASGTSQADFPPLFCSVSTGAKCASSDNDRVALGFCHASFPTAPFWKRKKKHTKNKKRKNQASSTQINIAVPLVHADDVITQLCLLGRLLHPPEGNSGTQKREQHIARVIFISVRVVQHIFCWEHIAQHFFPLSHSSVVVLISAGILHALRRFGASSAVFTQVPSRLYIFIISLFEFIANLELSTPRWAPSPSLSARLSYSDMTSHA